MRHAEGGGGGVECCVPTGFHLPVFLPLGMAQPAAQGTSTFIRVAAGSVWQGERGGVQPTDYTLTDSASVLLHVPPAEGKPHTRARAESLSAGSLRKPDGISKAYGRRGRGDGLPQEALIFNRHSGARPKSLTHHALASRIQGVASIARRASACHAST